MPAVDRCAEVADGGGSGKVAPVVVKGGAHREPKGYASLLALLVLVLGGCLNPRPEELPSALEPAPGGEADPIAALAPEEGAGSRSAEPAADPAPGATGPEGAPAPEPPSVLAAPEPPPDAGADSGPSPSAESADAGDAGDAG